MTAASTMESRRVSKTAASFGSVKHANLVSLPSREPYELKTFSTRYLLDDLEGPIFEELRNFTLFFSVALEAPRPPWAKSVAEWTTLCASTRKGFSSIAHALQRPLQQLTTQIQSSSEEEAVAARATLCARELGDQDPPLDTVSPLPSSLHGLSFAKYEQLWLHLLNSDELVRQIVQQTTMNLARAPSLAPRLRPQCERLFLKYSGLRREWRAIAGELPDNEREVHSRPADQPMTRVPRRSRTVTTQSCSTQAHSRQAHSTHSRPSMPKEHSSASPQRMSATDLGTSALSELATLSVPRFHEGSSLPPVPSAVAPQSLVSVPPHTQAERADSETRSEVTPKARTASSVTRQAEPAPSARISLRDISERQLSECCAALREIRLLAIDPPPQQAHEDISQSTRQLMQQVKAAIFSTKHAPQQLLSGYTIVAASLELLSSCFESGKGPLGSEQKLVDILGRLAAETRLVQGLVT